jgi:hypothetical protein
MTAENPARRPRRRPAQRQIPNRQKHEADIRQLVDGRVEYGAANKVASVRRVPQIPDEGSSIVDGALSDVAKGGRSGGRDDQTTSLGQGSDAANAGEAGQ